MEGKSKFSIHVVVHQDMNIAFDLIDSFQNLVNRRLADLELLVYFSDCSDAFYNQLTGRIGDLWSCKSFKGENIGFAAANNFLAARSCGRYLVFLNPDCRLVEADFDDLEGQLSERTQIVAFKQVVGDIHAPVSNSTHKFLDGITTDLFFFAQQSTSRNRFQYADGAAFAVDRQVWNLVGGFDTNLFMYLEDVDFCLSAKTFGAYVVYSRKFLVRHHSGASSKGGLSLASESRHVTSISRRELTESNTLYLGIKHFSYVTLLVWLPFWILQFLATFVMYTLAMDLGHMRSMARAAKRASRLITFALRKHKMTRHSIRDDINNISHFSKIPSKYIFWKEHGIPKS